MGGMDMFVPGLLPPSFLLLPASLLARAGDRGGERERDRSLIADEDFGTFQNCLKMPLC